MLSSTWIQVYSNPDVYKKYYRRFLESAPDRLHFAGHSHHYWPDVTRAATLACWDDSAAHVDDKWRHLFSEIMPRAQRHIARILGTDAPKQIVFAPNTHEFITRLISCFNAPRAVRILSTDSEFHSFRRQSTRLRDAGRVELTLVPSEPIEDFAASLSAAAAQGAYDLIFISHVFFNSGLVVERLSELVRGLPPGPMVVVDGYHGFCAVPTDLGDIADRIFYIAGGYKYAQSGEGACFMLVPKGCRARPMNTGWFAHFAGLEAEKPSLSLSPSSPSSTVAYSDDGMRFAGATMDFAGIYRFNAVMDLFEREGITIADIHEHVRSVQRYFLARMDAFDHPLLDRSRLMCRRVSQKFHGEPAGGVETDLAPHGHFLTFVLPSVEATARLAKELAARQVIVDYRGDRLRFGFGMYIDRQDVDALFERMASLPRQSDTE